MRYLISVIKQLLGSACDPGVMVDKVCKNAGRCMDKGNTHECRCQIGYTGSYCELQVDECLSNPCRNGGTCMDYQGGYDCQVQPLQIKFGACKMLDYSNSVLLYTRM